MLTLHHPRRFFSALLGLGLLAGCAKDADPPAPLGTLTFDVENVVGADPLVLDSRTYTSPLGEPFQVTSFKYYLSNFRLLRADGSEYRVPESYFLVRELRPGDPWTDNGKHFELKDIPAGDYTGVSFLIGVDEERNTAGAQTGALSPDNYMFWTWNQGYIFLHMEGTSPNSGDTGTHLLAYHVGDFNNPNNIREVAPPLPAGATLHIGPGKRPAIQMRTNLLRLFEGASPELSHPVRFGPFWTGVGGAEAARIATNYSGSGSRGVVGTNSLFTFTSIKGN